MFNEPKVWFPTNQAAEILGLNPNTLKRYYGHPRTGFLREGKHWKNGPYPNSKKGWCISECRKELIEKGFIFFDKQTLESSNQGQDHA